MNVLIYIYLLTYLIHGTIFAANSRHAGLPLTGVRAYYMPEDLTKTPKIRWPGVRVRPK